MLTRAAILGPDEILHVVAQLVDGWCERRSLNALRRVLRAYPLEAESEEGWRALSAALKDARASAADELTAEELQSIGRLAGAVDLLLSRQK